MSENQTTTPVPAEQVNIISAVFGDIKTGIEGSGVAVKAAVIKHYVDAEVQKRISALVSGLSMHRDAVKTLNQCRPDHVMFDENGKKTTEMFTKQQVEAKKKATEHLGKITKALTAALENNDFGPLGNLKSGAPAKAEGTPDEGSN